MIDFNTDYYSEFSFSRTTSTKVRYSSEYSIPRAVPGTVISPRALADGLTSIFPSWPYDYRGYISSDHVAAAVSVAFISSSS